MSEFEDALATLSSLTEADLIDVFGPAVVAQGRQLVQAGRVQDRELFFGAFTSTGIEAAVIDGQDEHFPIVFVESEDEIAWECDCPQGGGCLHVAALLSAWLQAPESFMPRNVAGFLELLGGTPELRDVLAEAVPGFEDFWEGFQSGTIEDLEDFADVPLREVQEIVEPRTQAVSPSFDPAEVDRVTRQLLQRLTVPELRELAKRRNFKLKGTRKDDILDQLVASLRETTGQPNFLAGLTRDEYEMLRMLNTLSGIGESVTWDEIQWAWEQHDALKGGLEAIQRVLGGLQEYGLLYPCDVQAHGGDEHFHWLPYLLAVRLPVVKPAVKTYPERKGRRLTRPEANPSVPAALASLVGFAKQHELRLREPRPRHRSAHYYPWLGDWDHDPDEVDQLIRSSRGLYSPAGVVLTIPPFQPLLADDVLDELAQWIGSRRDFASWLIILATSGGILTRPTQDRVPLAVSQAGWVEWYALQPESQQSALFNFWRLFSGGFTELALAQQREPKLQIQRTGTYYQQFSPSDVAYELTHARGFVTRLLQDLPAKLWYDWPSFAESARRLDPHFLHNYYGPDVWGFTLNDKRRLDPSKRGDWERGYRPVLAAFLEGPLRWLGVVEVGYERSRLAAFRVTPAGAWLLRGEGRPPALLPEAGQAPITWVDGRTFRLRPGPASATILDLADGSLVTATREAFVYELSNAGIQHAFATGVEPTVIEKAFRKAGTALPEAIRQEVDDLWSRFGHVHLYEKLTVLELADDLALRELLANTTLRQYVVHQFSPRLVVVEDSAVDALVEEMIKKGYTPKVSEP